MTRTVDDVIVEWKAYLAGIAYLQREAGPPNPDREPTDRELILAEITRLRAEVAQQAAIAKAWRLIGVHPDIEIRVIGDEAAASWNALCALLDPLAKEIAND